MSSLHISPFPSGRVPEPIAGVTVWPDGSLVSLGIKTRHPRSRRGGLRGDVVCFSPASRRRLMRLLARVKRAHVPLFVTLTYPGKFTQDFGDCKRDLDVWFKRLRRAFPGSSAIWRVEVKKRLSGRSEGVFVPHYHVFVWGVEYGHLRRFVPVSWNDVVGGDEAHLRAGTRVERLRTWRGAMSYASKYLGKADPDGIWLGRHWGVFCRASIPWAEEVFLRIWETGAYQLRRAMVRFSGVSPRSRQGFSVYSVNPGGWLKLAISYGAGAIPY